MAEGIPVSLEGLRSLGDSINKLDTEIDSASGKSTTAKSAVKAQIQEEHADTASKFITKVEDGMNKLDDKAKAAVILALEDLVGLRKEHIDSVVTQVIEESKSGSDADVNALREERKQLVDKFKAVRLVLENFGQDTSSVADPKRTGRGRSGGGSSTASGTNKAGYQFTMNGQPRPASQNKLSALAYHATKGLGKEGRERMKSRELEDFIKGQGIDYPNQDSWEVELPNGVKVGAYRTAGETASVEAETATQVA